MCLLQLLSLLLKNLSKLPNSWYWKKVMKKKCLSKKLSLSSNSSTLWLCLIRSLWSKLSTYLYQELIKLGIQIQEELTLWNIPRNGGMKTAIDLSIDIKNQEALRIGSCSKKWSNLPRDCFSIPKFKRSPTRVIGLRNSWIGLTSKNCQL